MSLKIRAVYKQGSFVPETPCSLPENSVVELTVESTAALLPPTITDPAERERVLERLLDRMQRNPIPADAPRWSRDELHDRGDTNVLFYAKDPCEPEKQARAIETI